MDEEKKQQQQQQQEREQQGVRNENVDERQRPCTLAVAGTQHSTMHSADNIMSLVAMDSNEETAQVKGFETMLCRHDISLEEDDRELQLQYQQHELEEGEGEGTKEHDSGHRQQEEQTFQTRDNSVTQEEVLTVVPSLVRDSHYHRQLPGAVSVPGMQQEQDTSHSYLRECQEEQQTWAFEDRSSPSPLTSPPLVLSQGILVPVATPVHAQVVQQEELVARELLKETSEKLQQMQQMETELKRLHKAVLEAGCQSSSTDFNITPCSSSSSFLLPTEHEFTDPERHALKVLLGEEANNTSQQQQQPSNIVDGGSSGSNTSHSTRRIQIEYEGHHDCYTSTPVSPKRHAAISSCVIM